MESIERRVAAGRAMLQVVVPAGDGAGLAWLYENGEVLGRKAKRDGSVLVDIRVGQERVERVFRRFPAAKSA